MKRKRFYVGLAFLSFMVFAYDFLELRTPDATFIAELSNQQGYEPRVNRYAFRDREMRYIELGNERLPFVLFVHGSPSSSSFWTSFLSDSLLLSHAKLAAVDRPGYGYSGFGDLETSVEAQAAAIAPILREKRKEHDTVILIGSSYGGTICARLAMDYPDLMDGVILQSSSVKPGAETTYWLTYPTSKWPLKWLIPTSIRNANAEKLSHRLELEKMLPFWEQVRAAVTILHGDEDGLIHPDNAYFARDQLVNAASVRLEMVRGSGHDLAWTARELILDAILGAIDGAKSGKIAALDNQ
ncbi:MAG: alpha/beta hydrolase [Bacteroidota bacterium]